MGYPIAEVAASGEALISKTPQTGGMVSTATCKEQLLYELHDPPRYLTPDVTANFTGVRLAQVERDVVRVTGGSIAAMGIREVLGVVSTFVPRALIHPNVTVETVRA